MSWPLIVLTAVAAGAAVWSLRHHRRFRSVAIGVALALIAAWVTVAVLVSVDYRDADGFIDCWPHCTAWQEVVRVVIWGFPVLLAGVGLGALAARPARLRRR